MNVNQLINMILRVLIRRGVNSGVKAGVNALSGKRGRSPAPPRRDADHPFEQAQKRQRQLPPDDPPAADGGKGQNLTPQQRAERAQVRQARRAKKAARAARRATRM